MADTQVNGNGSEVNGFDIEDGEESENGVAQSGSNGSVPPVNGTPVGRRKALHQVIDLQQDAYKIARKLAGRISPPNPPSDPLLDISNDELARLSSAFSTVTSGWTKLQDTKREIRGKGKVMPVPAKQPTKKPANYDISESDTNALTH